VQGMEEEVEKEGPERVGTKKKNLYKKRSNEAVTRMFSGGRGRNHLDRRDTIMRSAIKQDQKTRTRRSDK